jgi:hypothetical protein
MTTYETVNYQREGRIGYITLNRCGEAQARIPRALTP